MAENTHVGGTANTAIVAIIVLVISLLIGLFVFYGPGGVDQDAGPGIELNGGGDDGGSDSGGSDDGGN